MNKLFFVFLVMILPLVGFSQAEISFDKDIHDFASIKEVDGTVSSVFSFKNTGNAPLVLNNVTASCGCTTPEWSKEPILPGKLGFVKATYDPANRPGKFDKSITVASNGKTANVTLRIKGNVIEKVLTIEEQYPHAFGQLRMKRDAIDMSKVSKATFSTNSFEVYNNGKGPLIVSFQNVPSHIKMEVHPVSIPAKGKATIKCTYLGSGINDYGPVEDIVKIKAGTVISNLKVKATIEEDFSKLTPAEIAKAPIAKVTASSFNFNSAKKGTKVNIEYEIANEGKSDLIIRKATADCGSCITGAATNLVIKPSQKQKVKFVLDTKNLSGRTYNSIILTTNAPSQSQVGLYILGNVE